MLFLLPKLPAVWYLPSRSPTEAGLSGQHLMVEVGLEAPGESDLLFR